MEDAVASSPKPPRGIANTACLCYLNSSLQQLAPLPSFQAGVLALGEHCGNNNIDRDDIYARFVLETKAMVAALTQHSSSSGDGDDVGTAEPVDPFPLAATIIDPSYSVAKEDVDAGHPGYETLDPDELMDASHFLSIFFGQLLKAETRLLANPVASTAATAEAMKAGSALAAFRGEIVNELSTSQVPTLADASATVAPDAPAVKKRFEAFYSLSVSVGEVTMHTPGGAPKRVQLQTLEQSFAHFSQTEVIHMARSSTKQAGGPAPPPPPPSTKRSMLRRSVLPPHLIVHLKRFRFDPRKMRHMKLHDRLEFPLTIDVAPFTDEPDEPGATATSCIGGGTVYELGGVIIHRGTARNGHYFSLVRERGTGRWHHVDDDKVRRAPSTTCPSSLPISHAHTAGGCLRLTLTLILNLTLNLTLTPTGGCFRH